MLSRFAEQQELDRCPDDLGSFASGPGPDGTIKSVTLPAWRVLPTRVRGKLHGGGIGFANLVCRHQQALAMRGAR